MTTQPHTVAPTVEEISKYIREEIEEARNSVNAFADGIKGTLNPLDPLTNNHQKMVNRAAEISVLGTILDVVACVDGDGGYSFTRALQHTDHYAGEDLEKAVRHSRNKPQEVRSRAFALAWLRSRAFALAWLKHWPIGCCRIGYRRTIRAMVEDAAAYEDRT